MRRLAIPAVAELPREDRGDISLRKLLARHWRAAFTPPDETARIQIASAA